MGALVSSCAWNCRTTAPHHRAALAGRRLACEGEVGQGQGVEQLGRQRQHFGELREHQHAAAFIDQGGQQVGQQFELGALHRVRCFRGAFDEAWIAADLAQFQQGIEDGDL